MPEPDRPNPMRLADALRWGGLLMILMLVFLRALVFAEPFPYWEQDPTVEWSQLTGLGPAQSVLVDVLILTACAIALAGETLARRGVSIIFTLLFAIGAVGVLVHARFGSDLSVENLRIGSSWIAAMAAGLTAMHLCRDERMRRIALASALTLAVMLAAKGALQVFVEHKATVADYYARRDSILAARGWMPDSAEERGFVRRLMQPEASGWFGLANVYATVAAAGFVSMLALIAAVVRERYWNLPTLLPLVVGFLAAGGAVAMSGSRAGLALCVIGAALIVLVRFVGPNGRLTPGATACPEGQAVRSGSTRSPQSTGCRSGQPVAPEPPPWTASPGATACPEGQAVRFGSTRSPGATACPEGQAVRSDSTRSPQSTGCRSGQPVAPEPPPWTASLSWLGGAMALALTAAPLIGLAIRGLIGERLGELSLLFRWFYVQAASRIIAANPLAGVGPDGFKDAYLLAKNPLSPEEVASPHSLAFDHLATLGLFGLAWVTLWLIWTWRAGRNVFAESRETDPPDETPPEPRLIGNYSESRLDAWAIIAVAGLATVVSAWVERAIAMPEAAGMRVAGLALWCAAAIAAVALMRRIDWRWTTAIAALVVVIHGQLEMTPVHPGSAAWFMLVLGAAGAGWNTHVQRAGRIQHAFSPVFVLVIAAVIGAGGLVRVWSWQGRLAEAARAVTPVAKMSLRLGTVGTRAPMLAGDTPERICHDLSMLLGRPVGVGSSAINAAMGELEAGRSRIAVDQLREALKLCPHHVKTRRALSRLLLREAGARWAAGDHSAAASLGDEAELLALEGTRLDPDRTMTWAWLGTVRRARWQIEHEPQSLERAVEAWERAAMMDPHGLSFPKRIYEALRELGDDERARIWGGRLLEVDRLMRLDPLKGLTEREREEMARFVGGS